MIKEAGSADELRKVGKAIEARKSSDYLMQDIKLIESLRDAYRSRNRQLGGE